MGRTILIVVILMSTIYAGVIISVQREMFKLPDVMVDNLLRKEAENASDYAIRNAVRNAGSMVFDVNQQSVVQFTQVYNNYQIGNCRIDSIRYVYVNSKDNFLVRTFVRGSLQGKSISYSAEMAYDYPTESLGGKPNVFYLEMEKFMLFPWLINSNKYAPDTSGNDYTATASGIQITASVPYGGAYSRMCGLYDGIDNYVTIGQDNNFSPTPLLNTDTNFSLVVFAKIDKYGRSGYTNNQGTLMWIASDPYDTGTAGGGHPGLNLRTKPCAAIYYNKADGKMHFSVTQDNAAKTTLDIGIAYTRTATVFFFGTILFNLWHTDYPWHSFGLTYNSGVLKAYINGVLVGTTTGDNCSAIPSTYGISLGRRDLRYAGVAYNDYKYFRGLLDQIGMYDRAITGTEMQQWHQGVMNAVNILYIKD